MFKAIIQIRGYNQKKSSRLQKLIVKSLKQTKLGAVVSCEIVKSKILSCDGKNRPKPYMRIVAAKRKYATAILEELYKSEVNELVVITLDNILCETGDVGCGK